LKHSVHYFLFSLCTAQSSDLVTTDDKSPADTPAAKPEFSSTASLCAAAENNVAICHVQERENSSNILDGLRAPLTEIDEGSHTLIKPTSDFDQSPNAALSDNSRSDDLLSLSHSPSTEALDLTGCARKRANTAKKRKLCDDIETGKEVRLGEPQIPANDIDSCSESSSVVYVKDEILTSTDTDTDWPTSLTASLPLRRNHLNNQNSHKPSVSLDNANSSNSITEEVRIASLSQSDQVVLNLYVLYLVTY